MMFIGASHKDDKAQNSSNSYRNKSVPDDIKSKIGLKDKSRTSQLQLNDPIKKQRLPEHSPRQGRG